MTTSFEPILRSFLQRLDLLCEEDPGLTDTDVREILANTIIHRLVKAESSHPIPSDYQMLDEEGEVSPEMNRRVATIVHAFISGAESCAEWQRCSGNAERQALIARDDVETAAGNAYWLYLGPWDEVWE
jgi:hypothetical protein